MNCEIEIGKVCEFIQTVENEELRKKLMTVVENFKEKRTIIQKQKDILFEILNEINPSADFKISEAENDRFITLTLKIRDGMKWRTIDIFLDLYNDETIDSTGPVEIDNKHTFHTYTYENDKVKWMEVFIEQFNKLSKN